MGDHKKTVASRSGESREGHEREFEAAPGELQENGQHSDYWVLSDEERGKGFVRPLRDSYLHKGIRPKHPTRSLTEEESERYEKFGYILFEEYPKGESASTGRYWTQEQLNSGCGAKTTMGSRIAETYAREPTFYGATMCCSCGTHFPVEEFTWDGTEELVGS